MTDMHKANAWLILKATRKTYMARNPETGMQPIEGVKIKEVRQSRPTRLGADETFIKIAIEIPSSSFDPVVPDVVIRVPDGFASNAPTATVMNATVDCYHCGEIATTWNKNVDRQVIDDEVPDWVATCDEHVILGAQAVPIHG